MNSTELLLDRSDRSNGNFTSCQGRSAGMRELFFVEDVEQFALERVCDQFGDLDVSLEG